MDWTSKMKEIGQALKVLSQDEELLAQVHSANPWFTPALVRTAIASMGSWFDGNGGFGQVEKREAPLTIGIVMAGNVPLVGLHDLLSVLLAGHKACVKLSAKDALLIPALLERLSFALPVTMVDRLGPSSIDFLLATGSDNTARYLEHDFAEVPKLIRKNRFSVAVLEGTESAEDFDGLARDILLYHGMGCRSVSNVLVPVGMGLGGLWAAIERFSGEVLADEWAEVVAWEGAVASMGGELAAPCSRLLAEWREDLGAARIGVLHLVTYSSLDAAMALLAASKDKIQCVVGLGQAVGFGNSQNPAWDDFADGVDVRGLLGGVT
jgi:hypothetical protein